MLASLGVNGDHHQPVLGVDIGGSGMKAALVDLETGTFASDRCRIDTPRPARPEPMREVFAQLVDHFEWTKPIGCTFPGVIHRLAIVETAANLDDSWIGVNAAELFSGIAGPVTMVNDADAAGLAEVAYGAGRGFDGVIFLLTIGTGFGTAIFNRGVLLPNTELGHIEIDGVDAEELATSRVLEEQGLELDVWAKRLERYLHRIEDLIRPDRIVLGGGISKRFADFAPHVSTRAELVPAHLRNQAGIVGAGLAVANRVC